MLWRFLQLWHEQDATDGRGCWDRIVSTASMLLSPAMTQVTSLVKRCRTRIFLHKAARNMDASKHNFSFSLCSELLQQSLISATIPNAVGLSDCCCIVL